MKNLNKINLLIIIFVSSVSIAYAEKGDATFSFGYMDMISVKTQESYILDNMSYRSSLLDSKNLFSSNFNPYKGLNGLFVRYNYEFTNRFGIIGSFMHAKKKFENNYKTGQRKMTDVNADYQIEKTFDNRINTQFDAIMIGPTLRTNENTKIFGLVGISQHSIKRYLNTYNSFSHDEKKGKDKKIYHISSFAYAIGLQINICKRFVIDAAWVGSGNSRDQGCSGLNFGIGYIF